MKGWFRKSDDTGKYSGNEFLLNQGNVDSTVLENFRGMKARINHLVERNRYRSLAVTSSVAGEGKSFVCANLAATLASEGRKKVLLLDMDLRNSVLSRRMGGVSTPGLSEFLHGTAGEEEIVLNSRSPGLYVIPSGKRVANPTNLFNGSEFTALLTRVRDQYDYVIIDTPPVLPVSDALSLRELADKFILVISSNFTPLALVRQAVDEIGENRILGVVLNGMDLESRRYYKRYYGHYYVPSKKK